MEYNKLSIKRVQSYASIHEYYAALDMYQETNIVPLFRYQKWNMVHTEIEDSVNRVIKLAKDHALHTMTPSDMVVMWYILDTHENGQYSTVPLAVVFDVFSAQNGMQSNIAKHYGILNEVRPVATKLVADLGSGDWFFQHKIGLGCPKGRSPSNFTVNMQLQFIHINAQHATVIHLLPTIDRFKLSEMSKQVIGQTLVLAQPLQDPLCRHRHRRGDRLRGDVRRPGLRRVDEPRALLRP